MHPLAIARCCRLLSSASTHHGPRRAPTNPKSSDEIHIEDGPFSISSSEIASTPWGSTLDSDKLGLFRRQRDQLDHSCMPQHRRTPSPSIIRQGWPSTRTASPSPTPRTSHPPSTMVVSAVMTIFNVREAHRLTPSSVSIPRQYKDDLTCW